MQSHGKKELTASSTPNDSSTATMPVLQPRKLRLERLRIPRVHQEIYGRIDRTDADIELLARQIDTHGLLEPIVAVHHKSSKRFDIVSGVRRFFALQTLGRSSASVQVIECMSRAEMIKRMIMHNQTRTKTEWQRCLEGYRYWRAEKKCAKERQRQAGRDRHRSQGSAELPPTSGGSKKGEVRERVAKLLGEGRSKTEMRIKLVRLAKKQCATDPSRSQVARALSEPNTRITTVARQLGILKRRGTTCGADTPYYPSRSQEQETYPSGSSNRNRTQALMTLIRCVRALDDAVAGVVGAPPAKPSVIRSLHYPLAFAVLELSERLRHEVRLRGGGGKKAQALTS